MGQIRCSWAALYDRLSLSSLEIQNYQVPAGEGKKKIVLALRSSETKTGFVSRIQYRVRVREVSRCPRREATTALKGHQHTVSNYALDIISVVAAHASKMPTACARSVMRSQRKIRSHSCLDFPCYEYN